jgi:ABC-type glycerol-3-phosphate transport system substrate-binding protein
MRKIIRIAVVALAAAALLLACEDKTTPVDEPETTTDVTATAEPPAPPPSADQLEKEFAEKAKKEITADNADAVADELAKEIEGDTE